MQINSWYGPFSWIMVGLSFLFSLVVLPLMGIFGPSMVFFAALPLVLVHGYLRYGIKRNSLFLLVVVVFSTLWETLSINTGFPFGHYHYTTQPQFPGGVPLFLPLAYVALSYICWHVANAILGEIDRKLTRFSSAFVIAALASLVMTIYDLATDSLASTVNHAWIWEQGGALFGVPVSNYLGWMFCTFTFYFTFSLIMSKGHTQRLVVNSDRLSVLQFVLIYANLGITILIGSATGRGFGTGVIVDPAGTSWNLGDMAGTLSLFVIFGMFVLVFLAVVRLYRIGANPKVPVEVTSQS